MDSTLNAIGLVLVIVFFGLIAWVIYVNAQFHNLELTVATSYNKDITSFTDECTECVAFDPKRINAKEVLDSYTQNKVSQHSGMDVKIDARKTVCKMMFTRKTDQDYYL